MADPVLTWHSAPNDIELAKLGPVVVGRIDHSPPSWMVELPDHQGSMFHLWQRAKSAAEARATVAARVSVWLEATGLTGREPHMDDKAPPSPPPPAPSVPLTSSKAKAER